MQPNAKYAHSESLRRSVEAKPSFMVIDAQLCQAASYLAFYRKRAILTVRLCQDQFSYNNQGEMLLQER